MVKVPPWQHGQSAPLAAWSKSPLGRAPARPLRLLSARLAALGGAALPVGEPNHWASSHRLGCSSEPPPQPPIPPPFEHPGKVICIELPKRGDSSGPLFHSVRVGGDDVAAHGLAVS